MKCTTLVLVISLLFAGATHASAQESGDWRKVADAIPLGSLVKVRTVDGRKISGTLMRVDDSSMSVKRHARRPEAAIAVAFDRIASIERDREGGFSWGKAVGLGLGVGAGAILTLFVIAMQID